MHHQDQRLRAALQLAVDVSADAVRGPRIGSLSEVRAPAGERLHALLADERIHRRIRHVARQTQVMRRCAELPRDRVARSGELAHDLVGLAGGQETRQDGMRQRMRGNLVSAALQLADVVPRHAPGGLERAEANSQAVVLLNPLCLAPHDFHFGLGHCLVRSFLL